MMSIATGPDENDDQASTDEGEDEGGAYDGSNDDQVKEDQKPTTSG